MVVPSTELLTQNKKKIEQMGGEVGEYSGNKKETDKALTICTLQSLNKNADFLAEKYEYIIIDEAHYKYPFNKNGMFYKFLAKTDHKKLLGLTATPFALESYPGASTLKMLNTKKDSFFKNIIHVTQVSEVIAENRWAKLQYEVFPFVKEGLVLNASGNDFTEESIQAALKAQNVNNNAYLVAKRIAETEKEKFLMFVDSLGTAEKMKEALSKVCNRRIEVVSSDTKKKARKEIIETFTTTYEIAGILNYGTLTTGFDDPELTHIILARPTNSFNTFYQMIGRAVRVHPDKKFGTVVDLCGNLDTFGTVENIVIQNVQGLGWICTNQNIMLTNINLRNTNLITVEDAIRFKNMQPPRSKIRMPFGKYKGKPIFLTPAHYQDYMIELFEKDSYITREKKEILDFFLKAREARNSKVFI